MLSPVVRPMLWSAVPVVDRPMVPRCGSSRFRVLPSRVSGGADSSSNSVNRRIALLRSRGRTRGFLVEAVARERGSAHSIRHSSPLVARGAVARRARPRIHWVPTPLAGSPPFVVVFASDGLVTSFKRPTGGEILSLGLVSDGRPTLIPTRCRGTSRSGGAKVSVWRLIVEICAVSGATGLDRSFGATSLGHQVSGQRSSPSTRLGAGRGYSDRWSGSFGRCGLTRAPAGIVAQARNEGTIGVDVPDDWYGRSKLCTGLITTVRFPMPCRWRDEAPADRGPRSWRTRSTRGCELSSG